MAGLFHDYDEMEQVKGRRTMKNFICSNEKTIKLYTYNIYICIELYCIILVFVFIL